MPTQPLAPVTVEEQLKVWGKTRQVYADRNCEVHHASVQPNSYCSCHYHQFKWNRFYVLSGQLTVHLYQTVGFGGCQLDDPPLQSIIVPEGCVFDTVPGHWHRFENGETPLEMIEVYWATDVLPADIVRLDIGGIGNPHAAHKKT